MFAVYCGNTEAVKLLANNPGIEINAQTTKGWTALMFAVFLRKPTIVKILLANDKIDLHLQNSQCESALKIAIELREENIINQIIEHKNFDINDNSNYHLSFIKAIAITNKYISESLITKGFLKDDNAVRKSLYALEKQTSNTKIINNILELKPNLHTLHVDISENYYNNTIYYEDYFF